ncbi:MAG: hypothetical protein ACI4P0_03980, partial [Mailhella sp.]
MAREKRVKFVLEANDMASATLKKIGREADTLQGKLSALAAAGKVRMSAADLQRGIVSGMGGSSVNRSPIPSSAHSLLQQASSKRDYGLSSLITEGVSRQRALIKATDDLRERFASLGKTLSPSELQRNLLTGYRSNAVAAVTGVSASSLAVLSSRESSSISSSIMDWKEKNLAAAMQAEELAAKEKQLAKASEELKARIASLGKTLSPSELQRNLLT